MPLRRGREIDAHAAIHTGPFPVSRQLDVRVEIGVVAELEGQVGIVAGGDVGVDDGDAFAENDGVEAGCVLPASWGAGAGGGGGGNCGRVVPATCDGEEEE